MSENVVAQPEALLVDLGVSIGPGPTARLQDPDMNVRALVVDVVEAIGTDSPIPVMQPACGDANASVARTAGRAAEPIQHRR